MKTQYARLAILLPALFLGACSGISSYEALPDAARDKISSTEVVLPVQQREIYVFVPTSTAGASSGLIGALIDAGINDVRTSKAEAAVKPLRDALVDFDFDKVVQGDVKDSLSQVSWMHGDNVRIIKEVTNDSLNKAIDASKADAVLFVVTDYHLSNDGSEFYITARTSLFPNSDALRAIKSGSKPASPESSLANSLYRNGMITFKAKAPNVTSDRDQNIRSWSAGNGAAMRATLKLGAEKLAMLIAADLQGKFDATGIADADATNKIAVDDVPIPEKIVTRDTDGVVLRNKGGVLMYVTTSAL